MTYTYAFCAFALLLQLLVVQVTCQCDSYIAPDGSDISGIGTTDRPYFSLRKCFDAIPIRPAQHEWHICVKGGVYNYPFAERQTLWTTGHGNVNRIWVIADPQAPANASQPYFTEQLEFQTFDHLHLHIEGLKLNVKLAGESLDLAIRDSIFISNQFAIVAESNVKGTIEVCDSDFGTSALGIIAPLIDVTLKNVTMSNFNKIRFTAKTMFIDGYHGLGSHFEIGANAVNITRSSFSYCESCPGSVIKAMIGPHENSTYWFDLNDVVFEDNTVPEYLVSVYPNYDNLKENGVAVKLSQVTFLNSVSASENKPPMLVHKYPHHANKINVNTVGLSFAPLGTCKDLGMHSPFHLLECELCEPGTFSNVLNASLCDLCPLGTFASNNQSVECTKCPVGLVANKTGSATCHACQAGFIPQEDQKACLACPVGSVQDGLVCRQCIFGYTSYEGSTFCIVEQWVIGVVNSVILLATLIIFVYVSRSIFFGSCMKKKQAAPDAENPVVANGKSKPKKKGAVTSVAKTSPLGPKAKHLETDSDESEDTGETLSPVGPKAKHLGTDSDESGVDDESHTYTDSDESDSTNELQSVV